MSTVIGAAFPGDQVREPVGGEQLQLTENSSSILGKLGLKKPVSGGKNTFSNYAGGLSQGIGRGNLLVVNSCKLRSPSTSSGNSSTNVKAGWLLLPALTIIITIKCLVNQCIWLPVELTRHTMSTRLSVLAVCWTFL